jgi:CheY-like chemotaxis protein
MAWFRGKKSIASVNSKLPREELLRISRILVVDDEEPELIKDLRNAHFAVDYLPDITSANMDHIDRPIYDLILLDFGNVGKSFGADEGLSLLRHIKRVNPSIVVLSYTSKALKSQHADFFRLTDGTLAKDAGIQESMQRIEEGLRKANSLEHIWNGFLGVCGIKPGSPEDAEYQDLLVHGLDKKSKLEQLKKRISESLQSEEARKVALLLLGKAIEVGLKAAFGGSTDGGC